VDSPLATKMKLSTLWSSPAFHLSLHLLGFSVQAASLVDSRLHRAQEKLNAVSALQTASLPIANTGTALHPVNLWLEKEAQNATYALLRFLTERSANATGNGTVAKESPAEAATKKQGFVGDCTRSVQRTVDMVVRAYTEDQLHQALRQECALDAQFESIDAGFRSQTACERFAAKLVAARAEESKTGSQNGYAAFCQDYWDHKTGQPIGRIEQEPEPTPEKEEVLVAMPAWKWLLLILLLILGFCLCGYFLFIRTEKKDPKERPQPKAATGPLPEGEGVDGEKWEAEY